MVEASVSVNDKLVACDIEFNLPKPSYSIHTLQHLKSKHPWHEFVIIMGSDSFGNIRKWKDYKSILTNYPIYLYERRDYPVRNVPNEAILRHFDFPLLDISATYIRELIKNKKSVQFMVPEKALKVMDKNLKT
jgi:nicotinate-nucleotide adenylyltransferase